MSCCRSVAKSCPILFDCMGCSVPGFSVLHCLPELLKFMSTESVMPSNHLIHWCSLLLPPSVFPSIRVFSKESALCGGRSIGASASASILPMNIQGWFPLGLTGLISLLSTGLSRFFFSTTVQKHQLFGAQPSLWSISHICK